MATTPDSQPVKTLLNAIHDAAKWALHVALVPVVALLKAITLGLQHITDALAKI